MENVDKNLIIKRFNKSSSTYEKNAIVQKIMAKKLISKLIELKGKSFGNILELGCGTGLLTRDIVSSLDFKSLFVNDIVEESVNRTAVLSSRITKLYGDCESLNFPNNLDLLISNATLQWLNHLSLFVDKVSLETKKGGIFAFTTFEKDNLYQIKTITGESLNYCSKADTEKILGRSFRIIYASNETIDLEFNSSYEILKHLKLSGVNSISKNRWTKSILNEFENKYSKLFKKNNKYILTYKPLYFILENI